MEVIMIKKNEYKVVYNFCLKQNKTADDRYWRLLLSLGRYMMKRDMMSNVFTDFSQTKLYKHLEANY